MRTIILFLLILNCSTAFGFEPTYIAPLYFGPNALPIMDLHNGENTDKLKIKLSSSYFHGFYKDKSITPQLRIIVPVFTTGKSFFTGQQYFRMNISLP